MSDAEWLHTRRRVLETLADGPVVRERLRDTAGGPASLERAIEELRAAGFEIEAGDGAYAVRTVPDGGLGVAYGLDAPFAIEHHRRLASTNDRARALARAGAADVAVLADVQTGGHGRRARTWQSPPGGVYCSVVVRPALSPARGHLLTLAGAVAVVRAVLPSGVDVGIKWPNDVLAADGRKLAGVLTETATGGGTVRWAVVGIGLNAAVDPDALPRGAASLREFVGAVDRRRLTQRLLVAFDALRSDPETIPAAWREHARTLGRRVRVETDAGTIEGTAVDIDAAGALVLETEAGRRTVHVGDCEHLR